MDGWEDAAEMTQRIMGGGGGSRTLWVLAVTSSPMTRGEGLGSAGAHPKDTYVTIRIVT
jgi:hypothetical protein